MMMAVVHCRHVTGTAVSSTIIIIVGGFLRGGNDNREFIRGDNLLFLFHLPALIMVPLHTACGGVLIGVWGLVKRLLCCRIAADVKQSN